jgi:LemA protein
VSVGFFAALLAAAVLVFWVIGARNRLIELRNQIVPAWGRVQDALTMRGSGAAALADTLRAPMAAEAGAIDAWLAALGDTQKAAVAVGQRAVDEAAAQAWVAAEARLAASAARLLALLEQQRELLVTAEVAAPLAAWREGQAQLPFARQLFNQAAAAYNAALAQFPTRLVARALGLARAGAI